MEADTASKPNADTTSKPNADTASKTTAAPPKRKFVSLDEEGTTGIKPPTGYIATFVHLVKGYVGTGIFAMGEAFMFSGLIMGPCLLILIAIMNLNCQHLLIKASLKVASQETEPVKPTFSETVEYTFDSSSIKWLRKNSHRLGFLTNVFLICTELGFCCVYFLFVATHLVEITNPHGFLTNIKEPYSTHVMLAIILLPMWASTFLGSLKLLFPVSLIANIMMWIAIILIYYFTTEKLYDITERKFVGTPRNMPLFFGTALYAFEGITFVIPLRNEMRDPKYFVAVFGVLNIGMVFVTILFTSVGVLAYWAYGEEVKSSVFMNLPKDSVLADATKGLVAVAVVFTFTLHMYIPFEITYPLFYRKYGPFKHSCLVMALYRSVPVLLTYTLANVVPFLGLFISLIGASSGSFLALILPPALDLVAFHKELNYFYIIKDVTIIVVGVVGAVTGTVLSLIDIVTKFQESYK